MTGEALIAEAKTFEKKLLNFFWRQGVSHTEAEDLLQEVYLRLWKYSGRYVRSVSLSTFLFIVARQVRLDALRSETRRREREERWAKDATEAAVQCDPAACSRDDVRRMMMCLSEPLREVVELGVFQDMSYADIAEVLGIPLGTVKSRMFLALKKLKERFNGKRS